VTMGGARFELGGLRRVATAARGWLWKGADDPLKVYVYLHSYFRGGLRKTHVF